MSKKIENVRQMFNVPFYVSMTSFEVSCIPDFILFVDICVLLENLKANVKMSSSKFKLKAFAVDNIFSCYFSVELFRSSNTNAITVDMSFINGSREFFFVLFKSIKCAIILGQKLEVKTLSKNRNFKSLSIWKLSCTQMLTQSLFSDIQLQACQTFTSFFDFDHLLHLDTNELNGFKLAMIQLLESNKVDFLRYACIVLKAILKHRDPMFLKKDILIWKSMLCTHYQELPDNSIFSKDVLDRIAKVVCLE